MFFFVYFVNNFLYKLGGIGDMYFVFFFIITILMFVSFIFVPKSIVSPIATLFILPFLVLLIKRFLRSLQRPFQARDSLVSAG